MHRVIAFACLLLVGGMFSVHAASPVAESGSWNMTRGRCSEVAVGGPLEPAASQGAFCYRANFRLVEPGDSDAALYLSAVYDNDQAWLNGHELGSTGRGSAEGRHAGGYRRNYSVHQSWLKSGVNVIALDVRCTGARCGPEGPALLLIPEFALQNKWIDTLAGLLIAGSLLLTGLIFLLIGWGGEREAFHRWFSYFVLAGAVAIITHEPAWAPDATHNLLFRLESAASMSLFPLYALFLIATRDWATAGRLRLLASLLLTAASLALFVPLDWITPAVLGHKLLCGTGMMILLVALLRERSPSARFERGKLAAVSLLLTAGAGADFAVEHGWLRMPMEWLDDFMPIALLATALIKARVLASRYRRLRQTAYRDPLTGLNSRRFMDEFIPVELSRAARLGQPVTALFIDIDLFKRVNDRNGHAAGDRVLHAIAQRLNGLRREGDFLCRWGGEEFALFMFGQGQADAQALAERMRAGVAAEPFALGAGLPSLPVTISIGVAALSPANDSLAKLGAAMDQALYAAKSAGRNRVMTAPAPIDAPAAQPQVVKPS
jgi:diguanylate cyclase (GGDEF)-like protein